MREFFSMAGRRTCEDVGGLSSLRKAYAAPQTSLLRRLERPRLLHAGRWRTRAARNRTERPPVARYS